MKELFTIAEYSRARKFGGKLQPNFVEIEEKK